MTHLDHIEATEPQEDCHIHMGTFSYTLNGESIVAEFYLKTCRDDEDHQFADYNEQLTDEWEDLIHSQAKNIVYVEVAPCPI